MSRLFACFWVVVSLMMARPAAAQFVWLEAEQATANVPLEARGWGHKEFLSGDKWLQISIDPDKVESELPGEGAILRYDVSIPTNETYSLWNRIGYEFARSNFDWRLDGGAWQRVSPEVLTSDLMTIETWNEVAWLKLGAPLLTAGAHTLEIRLPKEPKQRVLYASDALCFVAGDWHPYGKFKPGEDHQTDRDRVAARNIFAPSPLASNSGGTRVSLALAGDWEVCRADEPLPPFDIAQPMETALPPDPKWSAIAVPSDKNVSRPDLTFAHRLWYRTRVQIPAEDLRPSYILTFPRNNLNTTVVVNGIFCGFNKNPNAKFDIDITKAIKPGQVNEIRVGIRDAWYGYATSPTDPLKLRKKFNIPLSFVGNGFQDLAYPVWNAWQSGLVETPVLSRCGTVYVADAFIKPHVVSKKVEAQVTLRNSDTRKHTYNLGAAIRFPNQPIDVNTQGVVDTQGVLEAGEERTVTVTLAADKLKLWWPEPNPALYDLRLLILPDLLTGRDRTPWPEFEEVRVRFGFREWGVRGKDFTLNGQVWHGWADLNGGSDPKSWLAQYRKANQRFMRLSGYAQGGPRWLGLVPSQALDFFDENGVVVRRSGDLDGEAIGYMAVETDPDLKKLYGSEIKLQLLNNARDQFLQQVKAERNHPSIHVWSLENEFLYINCINLYGGLMDPFELFTQSWGEAVAALDPTRLWMTDGGGAGKASLFPVHGDHYIFSENDGRYPDLAYEANPTGGGRGRWVWDQKRPRYAGEDYFATGINPADYAMLGGEAVFGGKAATYPAAGRIQRLLTEGYRWAEYGAWHLWLGSESAVNQYGGNTDLAVLVREQNWTFGSGQKASRTLGVFNDTFHADGPVTVAWALQVAGKPTLGTRTLTVPRGESRKLTIRFPLPTVTTRTEGTLTLTATVGGKVLFHDTKSLSVLPLPLAPNIPLAPNNGGSVFLYDPAGKVALAGAQRLVSLEKLPAKGVLVIGPDALTPAEATSPKLAAFAASGGRVVVLEQKNPLKFTALPAEVPVTTAEGRVAFIEDSTHPALAGLQSADFYTWGVNKPLYKNAYGKPVRGAKSLLQCDARLGKSALVEVPVGTGLLLLCQATVGENLATSAPAQMLLANLIRYAASYKQTFRTVAAMVTPGSALAKALDSTGVKYHAFPPRPNNGEPAVPPLLGARGSGLVIVDATPANLKALASAKAQVDAFTKKGGYLLLHGLTPEGLASYNQLVGVNHLLRPFKREKLGLATARRSALAAGMSAGDVTMLSGVRIFGWTADEFVADDIFTYVVDDDEVARFGQVPDYKFFGLSDGNNDHNPENIYNGFTTSDGWVFAFMQWAGSGAPKAIPLTFTAPRTLTELEWTGNTLYYQTTKIALTFDGKTRREFTVAPNNNPQTLTISPPITASKVELQIIGWNPVKEPAIVGIDNLRLRAQRDPAYLTRVRLLTDVGGMIEYKNGAGGIVLCNLNFKANEAVPVNAAKKQSLFTTLLRNLKAPFSGGKTVIAGASGLRYTPVELGKHATQFRNERGWFGDPKRTFAALPTGEQTFASVPFRVYDFPTSPVPTCVMLGGPGVSNGCPERVAGIPVGKKADALFFLQTARIDQGRDSRETKRYELARYVVTYADGKTETIPLYQDEDLADFRQQAPQGLPSAALGWSRAFDGADQAATAWVKQWNNPRPEVEIASLALEYGKDRRGVPVLLAVTAAELATAR